MPHTPRPGADLDADVARVQALLDALPPPLEPLDVVALDGYLCGVLLQPQPPEPERWWPFVVDVDGRAAPPGCDTSALRDGVLRRHDELAGAIAARRWFDPWVFQLDDDAPPRDAVLPWVAGFAAALEHFPALLALDEPALLEPLAVLFLHFDPEDLEDADDLLAVIDSLEPPPDLGEAIQDLVQSVMRIADVSRPQRRGGQHPHRRGGPRPQRRPRPR